jgi:hypothetical protein
MSSIGTSQLNAVDAGSPENSPPNDDFVPTDSQFMHRRRLCKHDEVLIAQTSN